ncbi:MAG: TetR/AcrR family transcriptional regulator C-terminal domain-containing protein [Eubacteriales bacterium]|nr:TetR/AcrR family transcriptional regulator C-terminal domain-containing protein [Eubacteriales bacterium]
MENKKDIEKALARSMKELVVRMPFEKITIKQIADGAGVIRVTFYNHFQDKYDLLAWIVRQEILAPVRILISNKMYRETLILIFNNFLRDRDFYMHALKIEGQNSFSEIVNTCAYELLLDLFCEHRAGTGHPEHPWMNPENLAKYYANSMSYIVLEWIRTGMAIPAEEMATIYSYIGTRSMWEMLEELK